MTPSTPEAIATPLSEPKRVAIEGAVRETGATYLDGKVDVDVGCPPTAMKCIAIQSEVHGDHAVYFRSHLGSSKAWGLCLIYTVQEATGWRFHDMACAGPESGVSWPDVGELDYIFVTSGSCANVRDSPGLTATIIACLPAGATVTIDGGPNYVVEPSPSVSHLWWHIQGKGWMAHDFLVASGSG